MSAQDLEFLSLLLLPTSPSPRRGGERAGVRGAALVVKPPHPRPLPLRGRGMDGKPRVAKQRRRL